MTIDIKVNLFNLLWKI